MNRDCECQYCKNNVNEYFCSLCGHNFNECEAYFVFDEYVALCPKCYLKEQAYILQRKTVST